MGGRSLFITTMAVTGENLASLAFDLYRGSARPGNDLLIALVDIINTEAYKLLYGLKPELYITTSTSDLTFTSGEADYPSTFKTTVADNCELIRLDDSGNVVEVLRPTGYGSLDRGFWLNDKTSKITLTPVDTSSDDLRLRFIPAIDTITALTDTLVIPDNHKMYGVYKLLVQDTIMQNQPGNTQRRFEEQANQAEDKLIDDFRSQPAQIVLSTHTQTNNFNRYRYNR